MLVIDKQMLVKPMLVFCISLLKLTCMFMKFVMKPIEPTQIDEKYWKLIERLVKSIVDGIIFFRLYFLFKFEH